MDNELDDQYIKRKTDLEIKDRVETYAAAAVARMNNPTEYKSFDETGNDQPSFK